MMRAAILSLLRCGVAAAVLASGVAHAQKQVRISVYVVAQADEDGFVAPGVPDSVRDLRSEIPKRSSLRLVRTADEADIVLKVIERKKVTREAAAAIAAPIGSAVVAAPIGTEGNLLSTVMEFGEYRRPIDSLFSGFGGVWKECAEQVSKQLHEWVVANREQIAAKRRPPQ
jgi:hypothetical protein